MKFFQLRTFLYAFAISGVILASCGDDDPEPGDPSITFGSGAGLVSADVTRQPGENVSFQVVFTKGNDAKKLSEVRAEVDNSVAGGGFTPVNENLFGGGVRYETGQSFIDPDADNFTLTINDYTLPGAQGTVRFRFTAKDRDGRTATRTITVTVQGTAQTDTPTLFQNVTLDTTNAYFSSSNGQRYNASQAQANASLIDFSYFFSAASNNNLITGQARANSTIAGAWTQAWASGAVSSLFHTSAVTSSQFTALQTAAEDTLTTIFNAGTPVPHNTWNTNGVRISTATGLTAGAIFAFRGYNNKHGLIRVNSVPSSGGGSISFDVIVQD